MPSTPGPKAAIDDEDVRLLAVRREHLGAVEAPALAVRHAVGDQVRERAARIRLRHADGGDCLAAQQRAEVLLLLPGRGVFGEGAEGAEIAGLDDIGAAWADQGDLLQRQHGVEQAAALAAIRLGQHDAEQALLGHQLRDAPGETGRMRALDGTLGEVLLGEGADAGLEGALSLGKLKVHGITAGCLVRRRIG
jgi:hypothetical protein